MSGRWWGDLGERAASVASACKLDLACGPRCRAARPYPPTWTDARLAPSKGTRLNGCSAAMKVRARDLACVRFAGNRGPGACPCRGGSAFLAGSRHLAQRLCAADTVQTKRAVHRFSAIRMRSLNDPRQGSLPTVRTVTPLSTPPRHVHQVQTDASVTIRPLIPTPAQRVSRIRAETDGRQR
jgi:hypothetical protein